MKVTSKNFEQKNLLLLSLMGMLPLLSFFISNIFYSFHLAISVGLIVYAVWFAVGKFRLQEAMPYEIEASVVVFLLFVTFSVTPPFKVLYAEYSSIFMELLIIVVFFVYTQIKDYLISKIMWEEEIQRPVLKKLEADLWVFHRVMFIMLIHLAVVFLYRLFPGNYQSACAGRIIYHELLFVLIFLYCLYEWIHFRMINKWLNREIWLPVVDESGNVKGKVAESMRLPQNLHLHPIIRIALIHNGRIFLSQRNIHHSCEGGKRDYPLEHLLRFKESLEDGLQTMLQPINKQNNLEARFLCRYVHSKCNRLIYLYICNVPDDKQPEELTMTNGKWWTQKQIEDNLKTNVLSACFEKEYPLLRITVLLADKLMRDSDKND